VAMAKRLIIEHHYLHSLSGGTCLAFGVFLGNRLQGALTLGVGPTLAYSLVADAAPADCLTLTRLWMSDQLPANSESRVLGIVLRSLRQHTAIKFLVSYADPAQGHIGIIYQATGWLYTGLSEVMPLYDLGDGKLRHSRSLSHAFGTHSVRHFTRHGIAVKLAAQNSQAPLCLLPGSNLAAAVDGASFVISQKGDAHWKSLICPWIEFMRLIGTPT
jgi:hypothetical protein